MHCAYSEATHSRPLFLFAYVLNKLWELLTPSFFPLLTIRIDRIVFAYCFYLLIDKNRQFSIIDKEKTTRPAPFRVPNDTKNKSKRPEMRRLFFVPAKLNGGRRGSAALTALKHSRGGKETSRTGVLI